MGLFYYYRSLPHALRTVYPNFHWESARFAETRRATSGYWKDEKNIMTALSRAEARLGIRKVTPLNLRQDLVFTLVHSARGLVFSHSIWSSGSWIEPSDEQDKVGTTLASKVSRLSMGEVIFSPRQVCTATTIGSSRWVPLPGRYSL